MAENTPDDQVNIVENTSEQLEQVPSVQSQNKFHSVLALLLLAIACALGVLYAYTYKTDSEQSIQPVEESGLSTTVPAIEHPDDIRVLDITGKQIASVPKDAPYYDFTAAIGSDHALPFLGYPATGDFIFDQERNYTFRLDTNWEFASTTPALPTLFTNPRYTLKDTLSNCYVTFADLVGSNPTENRYVQTMYSYGFASIHETQLQVGRRIDESRYLSDPNATRSFDVSPWRPYMQHEFSYTHAHRIISEPLLDIESVLVLHAPEGFIVTQECDEAFVGMLRTIEPKYQTDVLTQTSKGTLAFLNEYISEGAVWSLNGFEGRFTRILFDAEDKQANERTQVATLTAVMDHPPSVYKNTLYFLKHGTGLTAFNLFDGTQKNILKDAATVIVDDQTKAITVNDYFMVNETLYTLQGAWCNEYKGRCNVSLVASSLDGENHVVLAKGLPYRDILGFDAAEQRLYLRYADGDAGCFWGRYGAYDYTTKTVVPLQEVSGCSDETDQKSDGIVFMESLAKKFESQVQFIHALQLTDGVVVPITDKSTNSTYRKLGEQIRYIFE